MLSFYSIDKELPKLYEIVAGIKQSLKSRKHLRKSETKMSRHLVDFVRKEAPPFEKKITFAVVPMLKITNNEEREQISENILWEDLNDILERKKVINRIQKEYETAIKSLEQAKADYYESKNNLQYQYDYGIKGKQLENALISYSESKQNRKRCLSNLRDKTYDLIDAKNKFSKFIANRVKHGFVQYGNEISACAAEKAKFFSQMTESFGELRKSIDVLAIGNAGTLLPAEAVIGKKKSKSNIFNSVKNPFDDI